MGVKENSNKEQAQEEAARERVGETQTVRSWGRDSMSLANGLDRILSSLHSSQTFGVVQKSYDSF